MPGISDEVRDSPETKWRRLGNDTTEIERMRHQVLGAQPHHNVKLKPYGWRYDGDITSNES